MRTLVAQKVGADRHCAQLFGANLSAIEITSANCQRLDFQYGHWQGSEDAETAQWAPCKCQQNRIQNCPEILSAGSIRSSDVSKSVSKYFVGAHFGADAGGRRTQ